MAWIAERRRQSRFEAVVLPHLDAGYALARWLTRNDADAADIVQEACLRAFRYFDSYHDGDAKSWLLKIVRRTSYDWLERNRPSEVVPLEPDSDPDGPIHSPPAGAVDADALLESRSDLRRLDVLWFLLNDQIHHRGQFSVYLRMAGAKVPSIYGPSKDEPWH